eukprot:scaffold86606_cov32-Tisochrysis_lutea.AAC.1
MRACRLPQPGSLSRKAGKPHTRAPRPRNGPRDSNDKWPHRLPMHEGVEDKSYRAASHDIGARNMKGVSRAYTTISPRLHGRMRMPRW